MADVPAQPARRATELTFDADVAVAYLRAADPTLGEVIARIGAYAPSTTAAPDVFHSLVRAIVYQQLSGTAAGAIYNRLLTALDNGAAPGAAVIAATDRATLRGAGLSANKQASLQALAAAQLAGDLPDESRIHEYADDELIERYSAIRGIGRWTVEMLLLFHLGRPDVMPIHDLGVRKGYAKAYHLAELPKPRALEHAGEIWRPYRSVGSWYMWRVVDIDTPA